MTRRVTPPNGNERFCSNCRTWKPLTLIASAKWCDGNRQIRYTCQSCNALAESRKPHAR